MHWVSSLASLTLYEFAWAAISKHTLTTVLAAVKLEDTHRIPDPSIKLSPVQIQEGPFFKTPCVNHNHVQTAMETAPILPPEPHVHRSASPHTPSAGPPAHLLSSLPISSTELLTPSVPSPLSSAMEPPHSPPPAGTEILSENMPHRRLLLHIKRYNGELRATPMTSLSQETLAAGIDTTPSASSTQYVTPATGTPSANNSQQEMLHPAAEAFAPDETTPDTSADNGFTEIGENLIGTVRPAPEDVVIMQETTTKQAHVLGGVAYYSENKKILLVYRAY
ncbi:hypothetical protein JB92DRAFT_3104856 [Gautieria morchelliformis]|nr:hypothetical protein JB92DRAFT_3104856 [Gautieria morchelliformis]